MLRAFRRRYAPNNVGLHYFQRLGRKKSVLIWLRYGIAYMLARGASCLWGFGNVVGEDNDATIEFIRNIDGKS